MKFIVFLCLLITGIPAAKAQTTCENEWLVVVQKSTQNLSMEELLRLWKSKQEVCTSSSFYFLKLGWLLLENSKFEDAKSAFEEGLEKDNNSNVELELALADLPFQQATRAFEEVDQKLIDEAQQKMELFIQTYPNTPSGYGLLSGLMLIKEDFKSVIQYGIKAGELGGDPYAYRNLAIAYYKEGKNQESLVARSRISHLAHSLHMDTDFMLSVALSHAKLGEFEDSINTLNTLAKANPDVKPSLKFQDAAIYIRNLYVASQK